jgi:hypothetical protein
LERSNLLQIVSAQQETGMSTIEHLRDQAERAERLAKAIVDALTVERLQAFAAECRTQLTAMQVAARSVEQEESQVA